MEAPMLWEPGSLYWVASVKNQHQLNLTWTLPCLDGEYVKKPADYLSHLIGHEGAGSLLACLKAKGWASALSAGVGDGGYERSSVLYLFSTAIALTEKGLEKVMDVIGLVFQYLALLRQVGPQEWVFQELKAMAEMEFRFAEEAAADDYTVDLASNLLLYPPAHVISADYMYEKWDPQLVEEVLGHLTPQRLRVDIVTKDAANGIKDLPLQTEPWFGVPYQEDKVPEDLLFLWAQPPHLDPALAMPPLNEFIPSDFSLRPCLTQPNFSPSPSTIGSNGLQASAKLLRKGNGVEMTGAASQSPTLESPSKSLMETESEKELGGESETEIKAAGSKEGNILEGTLKGATSNGDSNGAMNGAISSLGDNVSASGGGVKTTVEGMGEAVAGFSLGDSEPSPPHRLLDTPFLRLWFKQDCVFKTPRANVHLSIMTKGANENERSAVLTELFVKLLTYQLNEVVYLAHVAKLDASVSVSGTCIELKVGGFNDKLTSLLEKIFTQLKGFTVDAARFEVLREELVRAYHNIHVKPLRHSAYLRLRLLKERTWPVEAKIQALRAATPEDLRVFVPHLLGQVHVEGLAHGNMTEEEALRLADIVTAGLKADTLPRADVPNDRIIKLPEGRSLLVSAPVKNKAEENSVVEIYFQGPQDIGPGGVSIRDRALCDLLEQMMYEPMYNQLRTKEQLGYRVDCGVRLTYSVLGFCLRCQSAEFPPTHLQARCEAFLAKFRADLAAMPAEEFATHVKALVSEKLQKDHSLGDETERLWEQIWEKRYLFHVRRMEAEELLSVNGGIKRDDLLRWFDSILGDSSPTRKKLCIHVWGQKQWDREMAKGSVTNSEGEAVLSPTKEMEDLDKAETVKDEEMVRENGVEGEEAAKGEVEEEEEAEESVFEESTETPSIVSDLDAFRSSCVLFPPVIDGSLVAESG
eukprot:TRINITY_DN32367_c0_g1_i1.p1 TRINITY_DN32367_c0_g1~~TRINITY_DN32367_c0_g1_i1.p1  ORF type:complete len:963 (+),score=199.34 TRINITY_DN32367_c0_g1_i1:121-2889(+)